MEREIMELYCEYEELLYKDIQGMKLQELFDHKFEILRLRKIIMEKIDAHNAQLIMDK